MNGSEEGYNGLIFKAVHFFLLTFSLESRTFSHQKRGVAQSGRAPALGAGGRGFKSLRPDQYEQGVVSFNSQPFIFWRYAYVTSQKMPFRFPLLWLKNGNTQKSARA